MVRYAIGLIFVGNCDGHVPDSHCMGILNLFGGPAGPRACVGTKLFWKYFLHAFWQYLDSGEKNALAFSTSGKVVRDFMYMLNSCPLILSYTVCFCQLNLEHCALPYFGELRVEHFLQSHHIGHGLYRDIHPHILLTWGQASFPLSTFVCHKTNFSLEV